MSKELKCSECGFLNENTEHCLNCGADLESRPVSITLCPGCNNPLTENKKFCAYCGYTSGKPSRISTESGKAYYALQKKKEIQTPAVIMIVLLTGIIVGLSLVLIIKHMYPHKGEGPAEIFNNNLPESPGSPDTPIPSPITEKRPAEIVTSGDDITGTEKNILEQEIIQFLQGWIDSRTSLDIDRYISHYSFDFYQTDKKMNYYDLKSYKKDLYSHYLSINENIYIKIEDVDFEFFTSEKVKVKFTQYYYSNTYNDKGIMTLILEKENGEWCILDESFSKMY